MKRTATTLMLLAGFGGGCVSPDSSSPTKSSTGGFGTVTRPMAAPGVQGPGGEPVTMTQTQARGAMPGGTTYPAGTASVGGSGTGVVRAHVASGVGDGGVVKANGESPSSTGILPVPGMGPPGAVAAVGFIPNMRQQATNQRTSIRFTGPAGMKITWQLPTGGFNDEGSGLTAPKEYNFVQGQVYRLRLSQVLPNFPGKVFYPTLEVTPATPKSVTFLAHSSVPLEFADEDLRQAAAGNLVVKVIYLPDPAFQDFVTVGGAAEEIVSTKLDPGADPVAEAQRRGTILAIIRLGNIDLENHSSPAMTAPPGGFGQPGAMGAPGASAMPVMMPPVAAAKPIAPVGPGPLSPTVQGVNDGSKPNALPPLR